MSPWLLLFGVKGVVSRLFGAGFRPHKLGAELLELMLQGFLVDFARRSSTRRRKTEVVGRMFGR